MAAKVLLGVSAGVAVYKAVDLASQLTKRGDTVYTIMTANAQRFVKPLAFRAVTRQPVFTDTFEDDPALKGEHITLSEWGEVFVIAPATADLIGRIAAGLGDDVLTTTLLAWNKPVVLAPAMNDRMWANRIVQSNIAKLRSLGFATVEPEDGYLACGTFGVGRLAEYSRIIAAVDVALETTGLESPGPAPGKKANGQGRRGRKR